LIILYHFISSHLNINWYGVVVAGKGHWAHPMHWNETHDQIKWPACLMPALMALRNTGIPRGASHQTTNVFPWWIRPRWNSVSIYVRRTLQLAYTVRLCAGTRPAKGSGPFVNSPRSSIQPTVRSGPTLKQNGARGSWPYWPTVTLGSNLLTGLWRRSLFLAASALLPLMPPLQPLDRGCHR
jgi:hypothetical protein